MHPVSAIGRGDVTNRSLWILALLGVAILHGNACIVEASGILFEKIAVTGEAPPGTSGDVRFGEFSRPKINASGQVLIWSALTGADVTSDNNTGLWTGGPGTLAKFSREGELVPGRTDLRYGHVSAYPYRAEDRIFINDAGNVVFAGEARFLEGGQWNSYGAFWAPDANGRTTPLVREDDPTVGLPGYLYSSSMYPFIDDSGWYGFWQLPFPVGATGSADSAMWYGRDGTLAFTELGINGPPPGHPVWRVERGRLNANGWIVYRRSIAARDEIAVHTPNGTIATLFMEGWTLLNGLPGDRPYSQEPDLNPDINDRGQVVFCGEWKNYGSKIKYEGIWRSTPANTIPGDPWNGSEPEVVAYEGMAAPGMGAGVVFDDLAYRARINNEGEIAFAAKLAGPGITVDNDMSYWIGQPGSAELVLREGDPAPGLGGSITISGLSWIYPDIDSRGQTVFTTGLIGPGITSDNAGCLWLRDGDGQLQLIAREGMLLSVAAGDERIVDKIDFYAYYLDQMNDNNQLAIRFEFTDGSSGVFLVTVPEPATLSLLALGGLAVLKRRRVAIGQ